MNSTDHNKFIKKDSNVVMGIVMKLYKISISRRLPQKKYSKIVRSECLVSMPDGTKLAAMVQKPDENGSWPVILIRNPYVLTESIYSELVLPLFAEQGYVAIHVRVRGTVISDGEWLPFENEREDGRAVIDWIAEQKWCNGNIGTYGGSYCGHTQWCIADYDHPALKTMFISVFGAKPYNTFYRRGMFRQDPFTDWAGTMMGENRFRSSFPKKEKKRMFEIHPQKNLGKELIGEDCAWYNNWIRNTKQTDSYWTDGFWKEFEECIDKVKIPLFLQGGWYDVFFRSQIETFRQLPDEVRQKSRYVIGPWGHGGTAAGNALKFPGEDTLGFLQIQAALDWFNYCLKGMNYTEQLGVVEAYSIGDNKWHTWKGDIDAHGEKLFYLDVDRNNEGQLSDSPVNVQKSIYYEYDPKKPTESCGGTLLSSVRRGLKDDCCLVQPKVNKRPGVVSFLTEPLRDDLHIAGPIETHLFVSSSAPATSFAITVMEMFADGRSVNIRDDITDIRWRDDDRYEQYKPGEVVELTLTMLDCLWMLKKGSKLRIDITSSNFPAYHVHPNTEEAWSEAEKMVSATQTIYCGDQYCSRIILPND